MRALHELEKKMMKVRNHLSGKLLFGKAGDIRDALCFHALTSRAGLSTARQNFVATGSYSDKIVAPYSVYKGKAALSVSPILPTFTKLDSGAIKVDRRGVMLLKFFPAVGERKYDWEKRQLFALSATEVGSMISLGPKDSCEFFHDPSMQSSNAGQVRKSLSIKPHADGTGYFVSLSVVNNILKTNDRVTVPVTSAEFAVMRTAFSFALPHIMGWDRYTNQLPASIVENRSKVVPQLLDSEWDK
ncbi:hypothetical protein L1049_025990 [Liquidambar formosana]|uniref:Uncharacterized protein n=1 Tax=Liquidambar formosana TaxID=63359 RepID=A0AAP0NE39_LIQFO